MSEPEEKSIEVFTCMKLISLYDTIYAYALKRNDIHSYLKQTVWADSTFYRLRKKITLINISFNLFIQ